jgi:nitroreductase
MDAIECINGRRSVRRYTEEPVTKEQFEEIVQVARMAPTWKNTQTLRYVLVQDKALITKIAEEAILGFEHNAKTLNSCNALVVLTQVNGICGYEKDGSFSTSKGTGWEMFDAGIAAQTFCLAAYEKGLGTCILGVFDDKLVGEMIGLDAGQTVTALITIGTPKFIPDATPRKEVSELVSYK